MKIIPIGQLATGGEFALPIDAATETFAFIARRGAGKTYAAGKLVEGFAGAGVQFVVLDSVGNWFGLRIAADGKGRGIDVALLGGLRGDIPLNANAGTLIADIAVESGRSLVLDVSQFSKADRQKFATAFGVRLWHRKKAQHSPSPIHLVIEESQLIVPENVTKDQTTMVGTYEEIIRLGRNYGIGCTLITQRPQSVNKEVLNQTECLFVLQVNGAHERKALKEWIVHQGLDAKIINELPALPKGTAFVWSPQWLGILDKVTIGRKWTFDSTATPKPGQPRAGGEVKPIDMEDLRSKMAEAVREAEANDPKLLQRRISELERELKAKPAAAMDPESQQRAMAAIHRAEILEARNADLEKIIVQVQIRLMNLTGNIRDNMLPPLEHLQELVGGTVAEGGRVAEKLADEQKARRSAMALRRSQDDQASAARRDAYLGTKAFAAKVNGDTPSLPIGERAVLQALIQYPNGLRREQLTVLTGYKRSTRNTYVQRLGERGYIATEGERIQATTEGIAALPDAEPLPTGPALQEFWLARLPEGEAAILRVLIDAYPKSVSRDHLSEATGYKRSTRNTYLQRLSAKELVSGGESIVAAEELF